MIRKLPKENMRTSDLGWLQSRFHFLALQNIEIQNINFKSA